MTGADEQKLTDVFQNTLDKLHRERVLCNTLETVNTALSDVQQFLAKQGMAFTFAFGPSETISQKLESRLAPSSGKTLTRHIDASAAISYTIDGQRYDMALADIHEKTYKINYEYSDYGDSYEYPTQTGDEQYKTIISEHAEFRLISEDTDTALEALKAHIVEQAAKQKFMSSYSVKPQPRRIQRAARQS